jgi:Asp-tRNA(Asn)/Glu-tRNA(Gln) amidotransferase B subunit
MDLWSDEDAAAVEAGLSDKQKKVVNFMVGKTMGELKKNKLNYDPKLVRRMVIQKLAEATHEEEPAA